MPPELQVAAPRPLALKVQGLCKRYWNHRAWWKRTAIDAAVNVSFEIAAGRTLALVGSSGSGKSTVARCVTRLERPDMGEVWLEDTNIASLGIGELRPFRSAVQLIFQDPATAMNPRMSAAEVIEEPLLIQNRGTHDERHSRTAELMNEVGLSSDWLNRRITEFSGGQKQRIAIARALALRPKILVLDEALSGLDLSTQSEIAELLQKLQATHSVTYLLISHDLGLVARIADSVAIMACGKIVEQAPTPELIANPVHSETRSLIACARQFALRLAHGASV